MTNMMIHFDFACGKGQHIFNPKRLGALYVFLRTEDDPGQFYFNLK